MRHLLIITQVLAASCAVHAQSDSTRYLFGDPLRVSGAGGLLVQGGAIDAYSGISSFIGGGGGILFDRRLLIGGYGMGLATHVQDNLFTSDTLAFKADLQFAHGGFWFQYSLSPDRAIHPVFGLQVGWGTAKWDFDDGDDDDDGGQQGPGLLSPPSDITDRVLVLTPMAGIDLNITRWFRPTVLAGYRLVDGLSLPQTDSTDLDGFFLSIALLFGGFGD